MGIGRMLWRSTSIGRITDTVKNIRDEGSIAGGLNKTVKEDITEDNPFTSEIYNSGKHDGKKEGYAEASDEYVKKLLDQADKFMQQKKVFEVERDEYEELLNEYEQEINRLENENKRTELESLSLQNLLLAERKLKSLVVQEGIY